MPTAAFDVCSRGQSGWPKDGVMSACDPKRTFSLARASLKQRLRGGGVHGSED